MLGSLNRRWPWKISETYPLKTQGEDIPLVERSIIHNACFSDPQIFLVIMCALAGFLLVWALDKLAPKAEDTTGLE